MLGVEMVERAEELVETVRGGQGFIGVAEMVFAELRSHVALRLEQLGDGHITRLQALFRTRQANLEQPSAESTLAGDERGPSGGATLLAIPIREEGALFRESVNVRRLVAHHALIVSANVPVTDVVSPEDEDVWLLRGQRRR